MSQKSSASTLVANTGWVYVGKIVTQMFSLLASILVIRQLPIDMYGTYTFAFGLYAFFQLFIYSPLQYVVMRFIPEMQSCNHTRSMRRLIVSSSAIALASTLALLGLLTLFEPTVVRWFNIVDFASYRTPFIVFVIAYSLKLLVEMMMMALLMHRSTAILNIILFALRSLLYIILLKRLDVSMLLQIEYILNLIYFIGAAYVFHKSGKLAPSGHEQPQKEPYRRRIKRFWIYSVFTELGVGLIGRTSDYYIISAMSGSFQVGLYGFAIKIYEIFYKILPVKEFDSVLRPVFFNKYNISTPDSILQNLYTFTVKLMMPVFIFPFIYFVIFGKFVIIHIFDPRYLDSWPVTWIILLGIVINGLFYPLNMVIQLKEQVQINLYSRIVVFFSIAVGIWLMKLYGIIGVAVATLLGDFLKNIIMLVMFRRYVKIVYYRSDMMRQLLLILLPIALFFPFIGWSDTFVAGLAGSILFVLFFALATINLTNLSLEEQEMIEKILNSNKKTAWLYGKTRPIIRKITIVPRKNHQT